MDNNPTAASDADRETHDFMNVGSFSQLPFIRSASLKDKDKSLRLFGIDFAPDPPDDSSASPRDAADSSRRFECHYCGRNFTTSQALGGHQNAHKRERQNAKRAHLHSAMANASPANAHLYGLVNYRISTASSPRSYPSWNNGGARVLGGDSHLSSSYSLQQPINGSPLTMWRLPAAVHSSPNCSFNRDRSSALSMSRPLPSFAGEELKPRTVGGSGAQSRFVYEPRSSVQDHVSLDLRL